MAIPLVSSSLNVRTTDAGSQRLFKEGRNETMILDVAQTALPEIGQKSNVSFQAPRFPFSCVENFP
jgi:hypothetical protein